MVRQTTELDRHIGKRLRETRLSSQVDISVLCNVLQVTPETLLNWEEGHSKIPPDQLLEVAQLLSCPLGSFFEGLT